MPRPRTVAAHIDAPGRATDHPSPRAQAAPIPEAGRTEPLRLLGLRADPRRDGQQQRRLGRRLVMGDSAAVAAMMPDQPPVASAEEYLAADVRQGRGDVRDGPRRRVEEEIEAAAGDGSCGGAGESASCHDFFMGSAKPERREPSPSTFGPEGVRAASVSQRPKSPGSLGRLKRGVAGQQGRSPAYRQMPASICTIDEGESMPCQHLRLDQRARRREDRVFAAAVPGRWAAPPAPAISAPGRGPRRSRRARGEIRRPMGAGGRRVPRKQRHGTLELDGGVTHRLPIEVAAVVKMQTGGEVICGYSRDLGVAKPARRKPW